MTMRIWCWRCVLVMAVAMLPIRRASAQSAAIPTTDDLRAVYDAGQYHACLQEISRLLFLKGAPAEGVDRAKLLLLRGHCLVKLKDRRTALKALADAEKQARVAFDPETALRARAAILILDNCRGLTYMPAGAEPIDVTSEDGWKAAAGSIYDAMWQDSRADLRAAATAQEMAPIFKVVPTLTDLVALGHVSDRDPGELSPLGRKIGGRAREVILRVLAEQDHATARIEANADVVLSTTVGPIWGKKRWGWPIRRGLATPDRDALTKIIDIANQAFDMAVQAREVAFLLGGDMDRWQAVVDQAVRTRDYAQYVLDAE
jgi:hypothetical protein